MSSAQVTAPRQAAREGKELIAATRAYATEDRVRSWTYLLSTLALLALSTIVSGAALHPLARLAFAIVSGLTIVRMFILYHDYMHGALLRGSAAARIIFTAYGLLALTPPRVWRETHNYHHAHTAKLVGSHVGSYAMTTPAMWARMTWAQRASYRAVRHPLTMVFGYFTIFLAGMCIAPFVRSPRKNWEAGVSVAVHVAAAALLVHGFGASVFLFAYGLPLAVAMALGSYLFYAQHNFPEVEVQPREEWSYTDAALRSSSYMRMGPVMRFFTGNIGYHHVHHLNPQIPFYRLPDAMAGIPELGNPPTTSLAPREIVACLRLKLWDPDAGKMVGYPRGGRRQARPSIIR